MNLPTQPFPFVGRTHELDQIETLLHDPACRLLTLVGPGGIGKTRLALEAAARLPAPTHGMYFVALQAVNSLEAIVPAIASSIGFQFYPGSEPQQQLLNYLHNKHLVLILDNFEHLLDGAALLTELLNNAPGVRMIVTSRERLNLSSETIFHVAGMDTPEGAITLFAQGARRVLPTFEVNASNLDGVWRICQRVGGMPLAILLAAAWVEMLPLGEIAQEIEHSLDFLDAEIRDLPERHHSIRAAFLYSWERLSEGERAVFQRLSIFRGGFSREAAQAVAGASLKTLMLLVNKSFVQPKSGGRYDLHELLRQYGEEKLREAPVEFERAGDAHCAYYSTFSQQQYREIQGPRAGDVVKQIDSDIENFRRAWVWAGEHNYSEAIWQNLPMISWYRLLRNRYSESISSVEQMIRIVGLMPQNDELLLALHGYQSGNYSNMGLTRLADEEAKKALHLYKKLEHSSLRLESVWGLLALANVLIELQALDTALELIRQAYAICQTNADSFELATALWTQLSFHFNTNIAEDADEVERLLNELSEIAQELNSPLMLRLHQGGAGIQAFRRGQYTEARPLLEQSYQHTDEIINRSALRLFLAQSLVRMGEVEKALHHCRETLKELRDNGVMWNVEFVALITLEIFVKTHDTLSAVELAAALVAQTEYLPSQHTAQSYLDTLEAEFPSEEFIAAVERSKQRDFNAILDEFLLQDTPAGTLTAPVPSPSLAEPLTVRELQVLQLLAAGHSNRVICQKLDLALGTVKRYVSDIYVKLEVISRTQAIVRARELSLLS